jgi:putative integral membrane protein (TIGR02587 family)
MVERATGWQQWSVELDDFARGAAGGLLFGIPLIYTMELWGVGLTVSPGHSLLLLALSILISFAFVATIGFRRQAAVRLSDMLSETIDAVGISLVVTVASLLVIGRIGLHMPLETILGRTAIELVPVSIGVAIANHLLPRQEDRQGNGDERDEHTPRSPTVREFVAAGGGALFLSLNIAPTDEVTILAMELSTIQIVILMLFSLLVTYMIVFEAGFHNQARRHESTGLLQRPITETIVAYVISLVVCVLVMWVVGAFPNSPAAATILTKVVVLGFPASLGAAAGRLAV